MEKDSGRRSRTRTGCLRCRQRKIRCDEGKPACQRCIKIKVECPGYEERTRLFGLRADECFTSEFDRFCFSSFMNQGIQDLASFRPSTKEFWKAIVPQLADLHSTVRHAIIAIAVIQEPALRPNLQTEGDVRTIAYFHFNKAIRGFLESGITFGIIHKLTCCLLFNELNKSLEMVPAGGEHIRAASSILREHEMAVANAEVEFDPVVASTFAPMILRCRMDAIVYLDGFETAGYDLNEFQHILLRMPPTLSSIGEAVELMDFLLKYSLMYQQGRGNISKEGLQTALGQLDRLLEDLEDRRQLPAIRIHQRVAAYLVMQEPEVFKEIVTLSEQSQHADWGPTLGSIPPLFLIATTCTDKALRERALELLHNLKTSEGGFTSCMATRLAAKLDEDRDITDSRESIIPMSTIPQLVVPPEDQRKIGGHSYMQQRVILAYGYSGILCLTPKIECDCTTQETPATP